MFRKPNMYGLFSFHLILRAVVLFVLCSLPVSGVAQPQPFIAIFWDDSLDPTTLSSTFRTFGWRDDYDLFVIAISREQPTQATTLTLYIEERGVSRRINETPYDLTDDTLPLQRQILIPSIETSRSSIVFQIRGTVGSALGGTVRFRYCDDSQTLCTTYLSAAFINDPPTRNINGLYEVFIVNSTTTSVSGANCTAVRERTQQVEITQTGSTASYQYTDDFGQRTMVSAVADANTYVFTAQYSTTLPFPGTRTFIMGVFFSDNNSGIGRAYWSYKTNNGDLCKGAYDVLYSRLERVSVQIRILLEGLLTDDSASTTSVFVPQ